MQNRKMAKSMVRESLIYRKTIVRRRVDGASHFQHTLLLPLKKKIWVENGTGKRGLLRRVCATTLAMPSIIRS
jgi:hypothetical protein